MALAFSSLAQADVSSATLHAKELLGSGYKKSIVKKSAGATDLSQFVLETTRKLLPKAQQKNARKISNRILKESEEYGFDPLFLMAVIQNESSFNPSRRGSLGEIGLMQLKPATAAWIAKSYSLDYKNDTSLLDGDKNVRIGAALLDKLRGQFESASRLYISAYNIGAKKVRAMVVDKKIPKVYVQAVMKRYLALHRALNAKGNPQQRGLLALQNIRDLTRR